MAILFSEGFEGGTNGVNVTAANSSFTSVTPSGSTTFSNAHLLTPGGGSLAAKCATTTSTALMTASGTTPLWSPVSRIYYRFYSYCELMPSATTTLCVWKNLATGAGAFADSPRLLTTGAVQIRNVSASQVAVSPTGLVSAGNFYRFEGMLDVTNAQQQIKIFAAANVNGSTPDYDSGVVASPVGTATGIDTLQLGLNNATTATMYYDLLQVNDAAGGFPGSIISNTGGAKIWNGAAWAIKPVKIWNGTAWVTKPVKYWNGTQWKTTP